MHISQVKHAFKKYALFERGLKSLTVKEILSTISDFETQIQIRKSIKTITTDDIRQYLYQRKQERLWSNKTFRNKRQYLKTFFDYPLKSGVIHINPVEKIEKPKLPKRLPRCLSKADTQKILSVSLINESYNIIDFYRTQAMLRTFLFTGMRLRELLKLKIHSVNLKEGRIDIYSGKGDKDRIIPIYPDLLPYLKQYINHKKKSPFLFSGLNSSHPLTNKDIYRIVKKIRHSSGVYFTPHMLRHTFGKLSIEANLNPFKLQSIMGHADISTTQIYVSVSHQNVKESFQKLNLI